MVGKDKLGMQFVANTAPNIVFKIIGCKDHKYQCEVKGVDRLFEPSFAEYQAGLDHKIIMELGIAPITDDTVSKDNESSNYFSFDDI